MLGFISICIGVFVYLIVFKLLFKNFEEFYRELKSFLLLFPITAILNYSSEKESLRSCLKTRNKG